MAADQSASTYPASRSCLRPWWRYARSGPHKTPGVRSRRFLNQVSKAPFNCQAIPSSPSRKHLSAERRAVSDRRSLRRRGRSDCRESLVASQHRPSDPRQLIGEGDDRNVAMGAAYEPLRPPAERSVALSHVGQCGAGSMDQLSPQVLVAALADSKQLWPAAGGELPRNETKPRSQIAPTLEAFRPPDGGDELCLNVGDGLNQAADIS